MTLAPHDTAARIGMTLLWGVLWALFTFGASLLAVAAYAFSLPGAGQDGGAGLMLVFGGFMMGKMFFSGAVCLSPFLVLLTALAATDGQDGRCMRALLGGAWAVLAAELGYRLMFPGDVARLGDLLLMFAATGAIGGWFADRPSLWPSPPGPGVKTPATPMTGLRPLTLLALVLVAVALWLDISANPGPQIG
jgi:hypothetical protein